LPIAEDGLTGELWLDPDVDRNTAIAVGHAGRCFGTQRVSSPSGCRGAGQTSGAPAGELLRLEQLARLEARAIEMYGAVLAAMRSSPVPDERATQLLRNLLLRLHAIPTAQLAWPNDA